MFHRPKQEAENNTQGSLLKDSQRNQDRAPEKIREKSPVENYVKNEKEKGMYQNQPNTQSANQADETETEGSSTPQGRPIDIPGNPAGLQRTAQPPRMPGAFPGTSYANAPAAGYGQPQTAKSEGRRLVVGEGISLSGEIEACDTLIVEGTIEAALKGAKVLEIAETGVFYGTVEIEEATVAGRFEGDLTVNGRLTIRASGSITGAIAYKELAVESGAVLDGKVTPLSGKVEKKSDGSRSQGQKKSPVRNENSGNELPFADKAMTA